VAQRILLVIPNLTPGWIAKQVALIVPALQGGAWDPCVCVLGRSGPFAAPLRSAGVPVEVLDWHRWVELLPAMRLRRLVRTLRPRLIHAWSASSLLAVRLLAGIRGRRAPAVVVTSPFAAHLREWHTGSMDRWLLRRADRLTAGGQAEADYFRRLGVNSDRIDVVLPAVAEAVPPRADVVDIRKCLGLSPGTRLIVGAGPLEPHKGFVDAIWTFHILKYVYADLHLVIVGAGSHRPRCELAARDGRTGAVHFLGPRDEVPALLAQADVVWVPSLVEGGVNVTLEAMAAGRPVVVSDLPGLAEIVDDGRTGLLAGAGDKAGLARQTRRLLEDADLRERLGQAARIEAQTRFSVLEAARRFGAVHDAALAGKAGA
jgi:glycosyltransferase involved in cell wall biosynthesis